MCADLLPVDTPDDVAAHTTTRPVAVRLTLADRARLQQAASDHDRSLSGEIRRAVRLYLLQIDRGR